MGSHGWQSLFNFYMKNNWQGGFVSSITSTVGREDFFLKTINKHKSLFIRELRVSPQRQNKKINTHSCLLDTPEYVECTESSEGSKGLLVLLPALQLQISFAVKKRSTVHGGQVRAHYLYRPSSLFVLACPPKKKLIELVPLLLQMLTVSILFGL